jgi:signal transduction histidine kinase
VERHEEHLKRDRIIQVAVLDREGWVIFSRLPQAGRINFADRQYFKVQRASAADELYISEPVFGRVTRQWAIQFTRPMRGADGRFDGLIIVAVPPPALELVYRDFDLGEDGVLTLVRWDGEVLARSSALEKGVKVSLAGQPGLGPEAPPLGDFRGSGLVDGVERFVSYRKLEDYPFTVFVGQSRDTVLAQYRLQRNAMIAGGVAATLLLFALMRLFVSRSEERRRFLEERERLMLELHDGCIQSVYAVGLQLDNVRRLAERDPARAGEIVAEAQASLDLVIQDLRAFIAGAPRTARTADELIAEMERVIPAPAAGLPGFSLEIDRSVAQALTPEQAAHVLRIAREAVSNAVRHARAGAVQVSLRRSGNELCLEVADDGAGLAPQASLARGLGLHHIRARARKLGGRATMTNAPDGGARITVEFPAAP